VNTGAPLPTLEEAEARVLKIQAKLHQWARTDPERQFRDLYNLVCDPAVLLVAWHRVRGNRGARSAGIDGVQPRTIAPGWSLFLFYLQEQLRNGAFQPMPVRERLIPKPNGKFRRLGIATTRDRVVQAALKLILEPVFEADFQPCSYGFRPGRRAMDAITEIHHMASKKYEWVLEGDITACFDEISHPALMNRVRKRIGDKRVLALVKAFLKAGILTEDGTTRNTNTGAPQGGILSPLLANIALSVLDEHFARAWASFSRYHGSRIYRHRRGLPVYKLIRYADDFVVIIRGTRAHAEALREEAATVLATMGLRLSEEKTKVVHIDEGFVFLGFRIQRQLKQGTANKRYVYTWPSQKALASVKATIRTTTAQGTNKPLSELLDQINPVLRGWTSYFRHGCSKATFSYLHQFTWRRVVSWLRRKHRRLNWKQLRRRYLPRWWPTDGSRTMFDARAVPVTRYRYRGNTIPAPWQPAVPAASAPTA
jgi:RNA-directed DNA polymerase